MNLERTSKLSPRGILALFTAGHIVDDIYMNALPPLLPLLIASFGLSYASAGLLVTFFTVTSSISQPFVGYVIDRHRIGWISALGLAWAGLCFGLMGILKGYGLLLAAATLAGLGPAMFHPHALSTVSEISARARGRVMSIFIIGGNIGFAVSPVLVGWLTASFGQYGMVFVAVPGIAMGLLIGRLVPRFEEPVRTEVRSVRMADIKPAVPLITVAILRSWVYFSVLSYLPSFLITRGSVPFRANMLLSLMLLAGVAGQFAGGTLSDRYGRGSVTMASLLIAAPLLMGFLHLQGATSIVFLFLFGFTVMASFSVTMVMMHEIMSEHIGMASGIMIGFALGIGGLGVMVTGLIADGLGLEKALNVLVAALIAAGLLVRTIRTP